MKKIKNPLIKRIPKELAGDWKKYMVVFLFLMLTIGFVSGMYVANESMLTSADESITEYKQEDGHFELNKRADDKLIEAIQDNSDAVSVTLYENFYRNEDEDYNNDGSADGTILRQRILILQVFAMENILRIRMRLQLTGCMLIMLV